MERIEYKVVIGDSSKTTTTHDSEEAAMNKAKEYKGEKNCKVVKNIDNVYSGTLYDNAKSPPI